MLIKEEECPNVCCSLSRESKKARDLFFLLFLKSIWKLSGQHVFFFKLVTLSTYIYFPVIASRDREFSKFRPQKVENGK